MKALPIADLRTQARKNKLAIGNRPSFESHDQRAAAIISHGLTQIYTDKSVSSVAGVHGRCGDYWVSESQRLHGFTRVNPCNPWQVKSWKT